MFNGSFDRLQNRLIFPAISSIFICLLYYVDHGYYRLIFAGFFCFFLVKEGKVIASICLLCSLVVLFSCWMRETEAVDFNKKTEWIDVLPDSIKINGDRVTFFGKTVNRQKIQLNYQVETERERDLFIDLKRQTTQMEVVGEYQLMERKRNPFSFDQTDYFKYHRISGRFKVTSIQEIKEKKRWQGFLVRKRGEWTSQIENRFQTKTSTYMNALLFGYKDHRFMESEVIFRETGLLHLFSLSGMHVQYFLGCLYYLFRRIGVRLTFSFLPLIALTVCFAILAGSSISVLRASLLFLINLALKLLNLRLSSLDCFSLTLWGILILEPLALFQVGGQLSVLISFFFVQLSDQDHQQKRSQRLVQIVLFTLAVCPLTTWHFYEWPILGSLFTLLFSPLFLHFFLPTFGVLFLVGDSLPRWSFEWLEHGLYLLETVLRSLDFSNLIIGRPSFFLVLFIPIYILWINEKKSERIRPLLWKASFVPVLLFSLRFFQLGSGISFMDVGQGDSIVFTAPFKQETVVIDTGGIVTFEKKKWQEQLMRPYAEYNLVPFLKGNGISRIDKLVLTHDDIDHVGEVGTLADHFTIKEVYIGWGAARTDALKEQLRRLKMTGTKIYQVKQGDQVTGYFDFLVVSPDKEGKGGNDDSVGLALSHKNLAFLFLGDLDKQAEERIGVTYPHLRADVVKLGHHGSRTSSSVGFIELLNATYGIISCGQNNRYGHPHPEVLEEMEDLEMRLLRTDRQGTITFKWHPFWFPKGTIETMLD